MALPAFRAAGTFSGTTSDTLAVPLPTGHTTNDIILLVIQTASGDTAPTVSDGGGLTYAAVPDSPQTGDTGEGRLSVFWARHDGGATDPTIAQTGNHLIAVTVAYSGCITTGDPWDVTVGGTDLASVSMDIDGDTTTVADCLVVFCATQPRNATGTDNWASVANADLSDVTERVDAYNTAGVGGAILVGDGGKAAAGTFGDTTGTADTELAHQWIHIALKPPAAAAAVAMSVGHVNIGF